MVISVGHCALELQLAKICKLKKYGVYVASLGSALRPILARARILACVACVACVWGETVRYARPSNTNIFKIKVGKLTRSTSDAGMDCAASQSGRSEAKTKDMANSW